MTVSSVLPREVFTADLVIACEVNIKISNKTKFLDIHHIYLSYTIFFILFLGYHPEYPTLHKRRTYHLHSVK